MSNLYLSFSVVFPLFCMMALGYFLKVIKLFDDDFLRKLNSLCFKVFLPLILFVNVYQSEFQGAFSAKLIVTAVVSVAICYLSLVLIVPIFEKENQKRGVIVQGIFRSNYILFGIPITISLYGEGHTATTAILIAVVVPLYNVFSVIALEGFTDKKTEIVQIIKQVIKNPLIIGAIIAFVFVFAGIKLPVVVDKTVSDIARIATPLALIALGGSFSFNGLNHSLKALIFCVLGKLIFVPMIFIPISILLGFRGPELTALLAMFASPTAVSSFTMAQSFDVDDELAGQIVVTDSILSIITIFGWIVVLKHFCFL